MGFEHNLWIDAGASFEFEFTYLPDGSSQPGQDWTGWKARMQVRESFEDATPVIDPIVELTTENGGVTLGAGGVMTLRLSAAQTAELQEQDFGKGRYDLEAYTEDATPQVIRVLEGEFILQPNVTI